MKSYNYKRKERKENTIAWAITETLFVFVIATITIILYDMYINIEVKQYPDIETQKLAKEVSTGDAENISTMLEEASKSVVRNIENNIK